MSVDLAAVRARADAATEGPWEHGDRWHIYAGAGPDRWPIVVDADEYGYMSDADAAFIASARLDVPALCDEVERLRNIIAAVRSQCDAATILDASLMPDLAADILAILSDETPTQQGETS